MIKTRTGVFSQGKTAILLFSLSLLVMFIINGLPLPNSVPYIKEVSDRPTVLPDTLLFYNSDRVYGILDYLGASGREAYGSFLLTFDTGFPLLYSCALALCVRVLLRRAALWPAHASKLILFPLLAGLFDYLENASMLVIMHRYSERLNGLAVAAGCFTLVKWLMTLVSAAILVAALTALWTKRGR